MKLTIQQYHDIILKKNESILGSEVIALKKNGKKLLGLLLAICLLLSSMPAVCAAVPQMLVGAAKADITGPITNISTGYNSLGDLMEGLLTRLYARAFVIDDGTTPMVIVSLELVHMTESIKPGVLAALRADGYTRFSEENVMLTATHCHSSTSNTSWFALYDLVNGTPGYDRLSYDIIVQGTARAIEEAYDSRTKGTASLVFGETDIAASNRSADAFLSNRNAEEYGYPVNADGSFSYETGLAAAQNAYHHEMAGIILTDEKGRDLGFLNFFGSHGTSNSIENRLVASDHKGYAALRVEQEMGGGFVAAFAQADSGDTSPNAVNTADYHAAFLRPNELDSSLDVIENQIVCGKQEASAALQLLHSAERIPLNGPFALNYTAVDFSDISVDLTYVGRDFMPYDDLSAGSVRTSEPCIGAGIIAGDEEGAPVNNAAEGAVRHQFVFNAQSGQYDRVPCDFTMIDLYGLQYLFEPLWPTAMHILQSDQYDDAQMEKVVCLAVGNLMQKAQPLQILRMGTLAIAGVPFELTFEQANRTRSVLEQTLSKAGVTKVIIATHANSYSQYVTTREEFAAQHYEGSTCLFGPWSGAALTQELDRLAQGIVSGSRAGSGASLTQYEPFGLLYTPAASYIPKTDAPPYGERTADTEKSCYAPGEWVRASFSGVNPRHAAVCAYESNPIADGYSYLLVQKQFGSDWITVKTDADPYTTFCCTEDSAGYAVTVGWLLKGDDVHTGVYRLVYQGIAKTGCGSYMPVIAKSSPFSVAVPGDDGKEPPPSSPVQTLEDFNPFRDVPDDAYYHDSVLWAFHHTPYQITNGVSSDRFDPDKVCSRAQIITFLWRAAGQPETSAPVSFADIACGSYYEKAVQWAASQGIARGVSSSAFAPDLPVTRAEAVTFLWRYAGAPSVQNASSFLDVPSNAYFADAVSWAAKTGVTQGVSTTSFAPDGGCTRGQIAVFLHRMLQDEA